MCLMQESHRQDQASSNTQCWSTEFGDICTLQPAEPRQSASESEEAKSSGAGKSFDRVRTGLGEVQVLGTSETADSLRTEFGEVRILGELAWPCRATYLRYCKYAEQSSFCDHSLLLLPATTVTCGQVQW